MALLSHFVFNSTCLCPSHVSNHSTVCVHFLAPTLFNILSFIHSFTDIQTSGFVGNKIQGMTPDLSNLTNLKWLNYESNGGLTDLHPSICNCTQMRYLYVSFPLCRSLLRPFLTQSIVPVMCTTPISKPYHHALELSLK